MERTEKEKVVAELHEQFSAIQGAVIAQYQGLSVRSLTEIRRAFRDEGVTFQVLKNTLARIAAKGTPLEVLTNDFVGPIAIAYSKEDAIGPARVATECNKKSEKFTLTCGYVDNERIGTEGIEHLSKLPGKDEMRGMLLNAMLAPATKLVRTFNAVPQQVAIVLSAYEDKLKGGGEG